MGRVITRPSSLDEILYPEGNGKNINGPKIDDKKKILQYLDGDDLPHPPPWMMTYLPASAPPGLEAALVPDPGTGEIPAAASVILPALLETVGPPFRQALIPAMETSGQDSTSAGSPRLYPPLPVSTDGKGEENRAIRERLHFTKE